MMEELFKKCYDDLIKLIGLGELDIIGETFYKDGKPIGYLKTEISSYKLILTFIPL